MPPPVSVSRSRFSPRVVHHLRHCLVNKATLLEKDAFLVFVCGGAPTGSRATARETFLEYAQRHLSPLQFFRAEDATRDLVRKDLAQDLLSLENRLAEYADCVLLLLESHGAIAELGAFAQHESLCSLLLAVNDSSFRGEPSFISDGPLAKVAQKSQFGPPIYTDLRSCLRAVPEIKTRLLKKAPKRGRRVDLSTPEVLWDVPPKVRMLFLLDLFSLFNPVTHKEVVGILTQIYGDAHFNIHFDLAMLAALKLLRIRDLHYLRSPQSKGLFFRFEGVSFIDLRSLAVAHYHKYEPGRLALLKTHAQQRAN